MLGFLKYDYLSPQAIKGLDEYKYSAGGYSWLDNKLNPFWYWCADQFPETMAPNLITLIGTAFLLSIAVGVWIFDPFLEGAAPPAVYVWFGISVWIYQTMDAVDGKQARRTKSSSPLGQLFDHGCDALGTMPLALALCSCMGFGRTVWSVIIAATIQVPFYMAQYEEHFAHSMRTQVANFGVTEGQYLEAGLMFMTALFGPTFWDNTLPFTELLGNGVLPGPNGQENVSQLTFRTIALYGGCLFPFLLGLASVVAVFQKGHVFACLRLIPVFLLEGLLVWGSAASPARSGLAYAFQHYPVPVMLTFGVAFTHLANRVIIATVCKVPYPAIEWPLLSPIPFLLLTDASFKRSRNVQTWFFAAYAALVMFVYLHFAVNVGHQIARHLKINILSLGKRKE
jgi:phosphatidylglycerophosphate synthase